MNNAIEKEFNRLGVKIGDEIEVTLNGATIKKVRLKVTRDVMETGLFPIGTSEIGDIEYCHIDHIVKESIRIVN